MDEAEAVFEQMRLPQEWNSSHILPSVYLLKQEYERAFCAAEENLMADWQNVIIDLRTVYNIVLKKQDYERALKIAEAVCTISDCLGSGLNQGLDMLVEVYLLRKEMEQAQIAFERYTDWLIECYGPSEKRYGSKVFFAEFYEQKLSGRKESGQEAAELNLLQVMYQAITLDMRYEDIRQTEAYQRGIKRLEKYL
ncbi:MAG: hypothetical protein BGN96_11220 [Bacteroidales bacterium 45-6]|nr:MAG: hypothetical protein BGN96_11220 [Bacteroidales bacterium 45-6]